MPDSAVYLEERRQLIQKMRDLTDRAFEEKRELTAEEDANYKKMFEKQMELRDKIEREQQLRTLEEELRAPATNPERPTPAGKQEEVQLPEGMEHSRSMKFLSSPEYRKDFSRWFRTGAGAHELEERSHQMDVPTQAGYLVLPFQSANRFIQFVDDVVHLRQWATKFVVEKAEALGAPELKTDASDADWTTELDTGLEETSMDFGIRELRPHPVAKFVKISRKLLRAAYMDVEAFVLQRLAYKVGVTHEKAFLTGDGAQKPLGVFTASANGIPTSRDFASGNTTTQVKGDGLLSAKYGLKEQYRRVARGLFNRTVIEQIMKEKDDEGRYLFKESAIVGEPDRVVGIPIFSSEFAPNTMTTGQYVGIFGDFSHYWIADALTLEVQRLDELHARTNQVAYIIRAESDGAPVLGEAFARIKLA